MKKILLIAVILGNMNQGCSGNKEATENNAQSKASVSTETSMEGYQKGVISLSRKQNKDDVCKYTLILQTSRELLDPINMDKMMKIERDTQVWVKIHSLRMPNRCPEARPVEIIDIKKRETN